MIKKFFDPNGLYRPTHQMIEESVKDIEIKKVIFFNKFHRGDLLTQREFVKDLIKQAPDLEYNYLTDNPHKLLFDIDGISYLGSIDELPKNRTLAGVALSPFSNTLYINTHVGMQWGIFTAEGGVNMNTLTRSWYNIAAVFNKYTGRNVSFTKNKEEYLPTIDYNFCKKDSVDNFLNQTKYQFKVLVCNNIPLSNQSFQYNLSDFIEKYARSYPDICFILTTKTNINLDNIVYTDNITGVSDGCDLFEISYLSTFCDVIIGKNSGPYVFCETYNNMMDETKTFFSFNKFNQEKIHRGTIKETMSYQLNLKSNYNVVGIEASGGSDFFDLSIKDSILVEEVFDEIVSLYEKT